jgi:signal transduction histidine kinase
MTAQSSIDSEYHAFPTFLWGASERQALATLWQKIAGHAMALVDLDDCALAVVNGDGTGLLTLASSQKTATPGQTEPVMLALSTGPLASIAQQRLALTLNDVRLNAQLQALETPGTLVCFPLWDQDQLLGALTVSSGKPTTFAPERMKLLMVLAEQAGLAVTNIRQAELVRDASRMKANFLSLITHELRSPLNSINGYLDLALSGMAGELNEQQREFVQRARAGSEHLYSLIEDLLLASRADAGQLRLNREPVSLAELVSNAFEELELMASDARVSLEETLPAHFPMFPGDPVRLQQVLRNLLSNALHATPAGGQVTVSARLLSKNQQKQLEISVHDTGCGIAAVYHERIFERFFQIPLAGSGRASGQGLGLTIVKMIMELHGGSVRIESTPGKGSTVFLTLDAITAI